MSGLNLGLVRVILGLMLETDIEESMRFELDSGCTECISEDIKTNAMTVGKYTIVNPNVGYPLPDSHKLTARGIDFGDNKLNYLFLGNEHKPPVSITIDFDWKTGVAAKDLPKVAKKGQVEASGFTTSLFILFVSWLLL
ncbi:transmembrane emp24 domain-containing protein p24delta9-like [Durio zibethinus]|uniref:Transmembrane emp24 domain-containing protein p24delta9-like n=1 Tax=Durio zibethinus TaxID=66656 RepID=A0A6P5YMV8_DURZI|nr:transmembrane emp24 domain-containing protein p24delta9-like [Durio zibethinus]